MAFQSILFYMIFRVLLATLLCTSFSVHHSNDEVLRWSPSRKLSWDDFSGLPPKTAANAALTNSGIEMKFSTDGQSLSYEISCNFDMRNSWGRVKNDHILSHEQGHFDIAEIHARKLNKALKAYRITGNSVSKDLNGIYRQIMDQLLLMQNQYDDETDYSRDFPEQKKWLGRIDIYLGDLREYANYR